MKRTLKPIDVHVGQRMRARRLELKMSQTNLADGFGLTFQQIQKYEKGTNRMGSSRLAQAAQILGVTPAYFFEKAGATLSSVASDDKLVARVTEFLGNKDAQALVRAFQRIKAKATRRAIVEMVEELAASAG